jgi:hypothetical protein
MQEYSPYLIGETLLLRYRDQPVNADWGKIRCLLWGPYETHIYSSCVTGNTLGLRYRDQPASDVRETVAVYCENRMKHVDTVRTSQGTYYISATEPNRLMLFRETVNVYCENHMEHCGQNVELWRVKVSGMYMYSGQWTFKSDDWKIIIF